MKDYDQAIKAKQREIEILQGELKVAAKATSEFLVECAKAGIKTISIGRRTKRIPRTESYPFGTYGSVFQNAEVRDTDGWPAIWGVVKKLGIGGGCGNTDQYQLSSENKLMEGVFELKGTTWRKVE